MTQLHSSTQEISTVAARSAGNMRTQQDELNMLATALNPIPPRRRPARQTASGFGVIGMSNSNNNSNSNSNSNSLVHLDRRCWLLLTSSNFSLLSPQQKRNSPHVSLTKLFAQKNDCVSLRTQKAQAACRAWRGACTQGTPVLMFITGFEKGI